MRARVAIDSCPSYEIEAVKNSINKIIANTDFPDCKGKKVLVKPNILSDSKIVKGITTNPVVVEALVLILKEQGAKEIYIGDSPGLHTPGFTPRTCGIKSVCDETGAIWTDFTKSPREHMIGNRKIPMAGIIDSVDVVISVAKFKTHQLMYTTGCVKNMFGTVPGTNKSMCHAKDLTRESFAKLICGIYRESRCTYGLMDAIIGMEGPGPANGNIRHVGYLIGSADSFSVDLAQAIIMGYDPKDIPILNAGRECGLTDLEPSYPLVDASMIAISDYKRIAIGEMSEVMSLVGSKLLRPFKLLFKTRRRAPQFIDEECIQCARCVNICPAHALSLENGKIRLKKNLCVRCYCCHEMCPKDAIKVK